MVMSALWKGNCVVKVQYWTVRIPAWDPERTSVSRLCEVGHSKLYCSQYLWKIVLLLLLSHFSHVRLCTTPETAAHQAPPSMGFSRQEHWSGLPFPSPMHESESESAVAQSCPTLSDTMDCSPPGSSVHGIFQARVLEWGAINIHIGKYKNPNCTLKLFHWVGSLL